TTSSPSTTSPKSRSEAGCTRGFTVFAPQSGGHSAGRVPAACLCFAHWNKQRGSRNVSIQKRLIGISLLVPLVLAGCGGNESTSGQAAAPQATAAANTAATAQRSGGAASVDQDRLLRGTDDPNLWAHYGGSYNEQRFSPLTAINTDNVADLGLAWFADYDTNQNQHGSPLYVDGVLYVSAARSVVHAFDARNGERIWTCTPLMVPNPNLGLVNRGLAVYDGKIYMGMLDAHLVAIDANTGEELWNTDTVPESLLGDMAKQYFITMAPTVAQ